MRPMFQCCQIDRHTDRRTLGLFCNQYCFLIWFNLNSSKSLWHFLVAEFYKVGITICVFLKHLGSILWTVDKLTDKLIVQLSKNKMLQKFKISRQPDSKAFWVFLSVDILRFMHFDVLSSLNFLLLLWCALCFLLVVNWGPFVSQSHF